MRARAWQSRLAGNPAGAPAERSRYGDVLPRSSVPRYSKYRSM